MSRLKDLRTAVVAMGVLAVKRRAPCLVTRDKGTGAWRHRYAGGVLINDHPRGYTWAACRDLTYGLFLDRYTPSEGDIVVELGAGVGTETVFLAKAVGKTGRVVACEASPRAASLLRATLAANKITNVEVAEVAVMDRPGNVDLLDRRGDVHSSLFKGTSQSAFKTEAIPVEGITVDGLIERHRLDRVDLLKVNIEGAENLMVEGMAATLPLLRHAVVSCHDFVADKRPGNEHARSREKVSTFFLSHGFQVDFRPDEPGKPWMRDYLYVSASRLTTR